MFCSNYLILLNKLETRVRSANLFLMGVIYSEDYMTQFLDHFIPNLIWHCIPRSKEKADVHVAETIG